MFSFVTIDRSGTGMRFVFHVWVDHRRGHRRHRAARDRRAGPQADEEALSPFRGASCGYVIERTMGRHPQKNS
jgi:hypothetical protein